MTDFETLLITGANSGLGKEAARQLAHLPSMKRIYLGCRNQQKADAARLELEAATGKAVFEFVEVDTTKLGTVSSCVEQIEGPVDGVILNAGGMGGPNPTELTRDGVTCCFAANVLGHAALVETLIEAQK
ncbi:MAG: SDR family NAD(P)-dependent oxidoreductase, partial [Myxococcales bacterium]|nr:SDR family NAD(P)-dependent oxidoreductase [Myxococcales bacterium]